MVPIFLDAKRMLPGAVVNVGYYRLFSQVPFLQDSGAGGKQRLSGTA
jgi:hypothetical protein